MVHIHGGAFIHGSGSLKIASFDHLVNYDVIMVTFSQRLHILGERKTEDFFYRVNTDSFAKYILRILELEHAELYWKLRR